ncbi:MAG TPA: membrane dipeptidase [Solirubrobacteraceae bacterium]|jgi:D-arabinono-1,4-lactone oxidase|nr:membrane dipeptidase [Solirubrobacteraceae bacterium]
MTIERDPEDHFYHPSTHAELVSLVEMAHAHRLKIRVRGSGHSVADAIYTDHVSRSYDAIPEPTAPRGDDIDILLDHYRAFSVSCEQERLVTVQAGIHLGEIPGDPNATLEESLLGQLWDRGWTLSETGGIAHQTVGGFTATGSAGGSLRFSFSDDLWSFCLIDGAGQTHDIGREDPRFHAMAPHLGLLGIVSTITLQCEPRFHVTGKQVTTTYDACAIDLDGSGSGDKPSLQTFLIGAPYARVEWWPQRDGRSERRHARGEHVLVWQCARTEEENPQLSPFQQFTGDPAVVEPVIAILLTLLGNLQDGARAIRELKPILDALPPDFLARLEAVEGLRGVDDHIATIVNKYRGAGLELATLRPVRELLERELPRLFPALLDAFLPPGTQEFVDTAMHGLPMDIDASDTNLPAQFTEMWVPLDRTQEVVKLLRDYFDEPDDIDEAYRRTGTFAFEFYAEKANGFWLSPAYSQPGDKWARGAFRVDVFWYARNAADPAKSFFSQFWNLLRDNHIPFRLHWGKFQPPADDDPTWLAQIREQYPRWKDFLDLRAELDPRDIFLTDYWRKRLGVRGPRIAELHCHYPMQLLSAPYPAPPGDTGRWSRWLDRRRARLMWSLSRRFNFTNRHTSWRVRFEGLVEANVQIVLSALYDPMYEFISRPCISTPRAGAFARLEVQLDQVENELQLSDPGALRHVVVTSQAQLEEALARRCMAFVHCVEGGFQLGTITDEITTNVATLAQRGIAYITLAHLFYRGIAADAPAIPMIPDRWYDRMFCQGGDVGLTELGRAAIAAMYEHGILVDVTHMRADALAQTFALLRDLDREHRADPTAYPVIASHAGYRFGTQAYMLDVHTIEEIARRDGVIGLILARHQLQDGLADANVIEHTFQTLASHIDRIYEITGSHRHTCIGSDLDGFVKPTMSGIESSRDLTSLARWLDRRYKGDAEAIRFGNALRVIGARFA